MKWTAGKFVFEFPRPMLIMGIVNVTPDSFFDGGRYFDVEKAVAHGLELAAQGADLLDIGGESTRPQAEPVTEAEELRRVLPVLDRLSAAGAPPLSIDTQKVAVARAALEAGACIVNDVGANRQDTAMWELVAEKKAGYVAMHMRGTPQTMQEHPEYVDVVDTVDGFFGERLERLKASGVRPDQVVLDVGIGFGKTLEHNLQLLASLSRFKRWHRPLLLGVSRKSFIGALLGVKVEERLPGGLACACWAAQNGVSILRTHDVAETVQAVRMYEAILAHKKT